jgi:phosphoglycerate dehydrogenase-like enzyme
MQLLLDTQHGIYYVLSICTHCNNLGFMNHHFNILYKFPAGAAAHALMRDVLPPELILLTLDTPDRAELFAELAVADFIITAKLDGEMIAAAPRLKLIQLAGVGFDGVDVTAATARGIPVAQTVEGTIIGVAEHTLLLILALYKQLLVADAALRRGEWLVWQLRPTSYTLHGKTVGIVGFGKIGREVARRCQAFGAQVIYADVLRADAATEGELGARQVARDKLLATADVVSVHTPLAPETRGSFDETAFRQMKPTAIFINTSRGEVVNEPALLRALQEKWIAGAGLDVFAQEPIAADHPLLQLPNVVLTPHIATGTRDSIIEKTRAACDNFHRVINGERPINVINQQIYRNQENVFPRS